MDNELPAPGFSPDGLWTLAWVLGLVAAGALIRLLVYAGNNSDVEPGLFVWALLGAIAATFSASCAVLAGLKSAELRLAEQVRRSLT